MAPPLQSVLTWACFSCQFVSASLVLPRASEFELSRFSGSVRTEQIPFRTNEPGSHARFQPGDFTKHEQDDSVCKVYGEKQWTGTVDVTEERRLFYWFFDSRNDPDNDPIIIWLNGFVERSP